MEINTDSEYVRRPELSELDVMFASEFVVNPELQVTLGNFSGKLAQFAGTHDEAMQQLDGALTGFSRAERRNLASQLHGENPTDYLYAMTLSAAMGIFLYQRYDWVRDQVDASPIPEDEEFGVIVAKNIFPEIAVTIHPPLLSMREAVRSISERIHTHYEAIFEDVDSVNGSLGGLENGYELLKYYIFSDIEKDETAYSLVALLRLGQEALTTNGVIQQYMEQYEGNEFSGSLLRDIYKGALLANGDRYVGKDLRHIIDLVTVVRNCSDLEAPVLVERLIESFNQLPQNARNELHTLARRFTQAATDRTKIAAGILESVHMSVDDAGRRVSEYSTFDRVMDRVAYAGKVAVVGGQGPVDPKRRRLIILRATEDLDEEYPAVTPEEAKESARMYLRGYNGHLDITDQESFNVAMSTKREDLLKISGFEEDLRRAIQHLSTVDFSNGHIKGVSKIKHEIHLDGESCDIYSFKPMDAAGLSLPTKAGKKLRIIFRIVPDGYEIVEILQRDEVNTFFRAHGIGNARSKGSQK